LLIFSMHTDILKCRLGRSFILSYFFLFAASTLTYTPLYERLNKDGDAHGVADIRMPRLFLLELIGSEIACRSCNGTYPSPFGIILLKKKAVLPTEDLTEKNLADDHEALAHSPALCENAATASSGCNDMVSPDSLPLSFYSGTSPPQV
jgi:hypothetical protein